MGRVARTEAPIEERRAEALAEAAARIAEELEAVDLEAEPALADALIAALAAIDRAYALETAPAAPGVGR